MRTHLLHFMVVSTVLALPAGMTAQVVPGGMSAHGSPAAAQVLLAHQQELALQPGEVLRLNVMAAPRAPTERTVVAIRGLDRVPGKNTVPVVSRGIALVPASAAAPRETVRIVALDRVPGKISAPRIERRVGGPDPGAICPLMFLGAERMELAHQLIASAN